MELVIGGRSQGKLEYGKKLCGNSDSLIFNKLQEYIYNGVIADKTETEILGEIQEIINKNPNCIIICDEVGAGLVPMEKMQRHYRDMVGSICCELAKQATRVHRVICGIGTVIKDA